MLGERAISMSVTMAMAMTSNSNDHESTKYSRLSLFVVRVTHLHH